MTEKTRLAAQDVTRESANRNPDESAGRNAGKASGSGTRKVAHAKSDKTASKIAGNARSRMTRGGRSREKTRRKLVQAAMRVMGDKGVDGAAIADITEEADVGFGSFYNHFKSKAEIARVVFDTYAKEIGEIAHAISAREEDPAVVVATIHKVFLTRTVIDPVWGRFIVNAAVGLPDLWRIFARQGLDDIHRGMESGRFSVPSAETAMLLILAALMTTMRLLLERSDAKEKSADTNTIVCLMQMLGVEKSDVPALAAAPLPAYVREMLEEKMRLH